jgi:hypothetical protein
MNQLTIHQLYIFEPKNKLGKRVDFTKGINIITSDKKRGNDVGKSIILKSIYHTLGADSVFDDMWKEIPKVYIVNFSINDVYFYIYRSDKLFKVYNEKMERLFHTANRSELAGYLKELYGFSVKLPNKETEEMELAPPVYSYLLNYVDQDKMEGPKFESFDSLFQFKKDKKAILFNHFGIYTDEYFETVEKLEKLKREEKDLKEDLVVTTNMLKRVSCYLEGYDAPNNLELLRQQLESKKAEYTVLVNDMKKYKNRLLSLRSDRAKLESDITDLQNWSRSKEKDIKVVLDHRCPTCSQQIEDDFTIKLSQYNQLEDFLIMKNHLDTEMLQIERQLLQNEEKYQYLIEKLELFEKEMNFNSSDISDALKHRGYLEAQNNMLKESGTIQQKIEINQEEIDNNNKILKKYKEMEKSANESYKQLMIESIIRFDLKEISTKKVEKINSSFNARGSNIPISTIIWYFNLLKVKFELNPNAIRFPLLLDSPNNVESDEEKETALFNFIFKNNNPNTQLIVSTLGFKEEEYEDIKFDKVTNLEVRKYSLLNKEEYDQNKKLLKLVFQED